MIRWALFLLVLYVAYRVVRRFFGSRSPRPHRGDAERIDDVMIKDPECGTYFPVRDGVVLKRGDRELLFCSRECRDRYVDSGKSEG
jgi:uncharacterized protein